MVDDGGKEVAGGDKKEDVDETRKIVGKKISIKIKTPIPIHKNDDG